MGHAGVDDQTGGLLFLSHAGADTEAAEALRSAILNSVSAKSEFLDVWLDTKDLRPGDWQAQIEAALNRATAFAVLIGKGGVRNWVLPEVRAALDRAVTEGVPFIPVSLEPGFDPDDLPLFMRQYQIIAAPLSDERALADLIRRARSGDARPVVVAENPFVGLRAMTEAEQHLFFGRDAEINTIVGNLRASQLVAILADSGAGKSSLARAGVAPAFRRGAIEDGARSGSDRIWHVVTMRPGSDPMLGLTRGLDDAAASLGIASEDRVRLSGVLADGNASAIALALTCDQPASRTETLLIVDQFEELLTQTPDKERAAFMTLLLELARTGTGVRVLLTVRADYFNFVRAHADFWGRLHEDPNAIVRLKGLSDAGLAEAIARPPDAGGL